MTTIKTEGFDIPGGMSRPHYHRPFSDGSMTIETDMLASLSQSVPHHQPMASPFSFAQSLPTHHSLDHFMTSPPTNNLDLTQQSPQPNSFHPASLFNGFKFGLDNPEPPVNFPPISSLGSEYDQRARSLSSSRASHIGKAPSSRTRQPRKLSMNEGRPPSAGQQPRGRAGQLHPRTMSHSDAYGGRLGLGIGLDTHKEGETTDSVTPPDFQIGGAYGVAIPRGMESGSWASNGSAPSLIPGSYGSYVHDEAILDSPITPAQPLPIGLPVDDSYKKQRRRECHNQVEKRRREHINAKIEELSRLLPAHYNENDEAIEDEDEDDHAETSPIKKKKNKRSGSSKQQRDAAHCKGRILSQSVRYIHDLRDMTQMQASKISHLESLLGLAATSSMPVQDTSSANDLMWYAAHAGQHSGMVPHTNLEPLAENQLEMMRPSPEPEFPAPWSGSHATNGNNGMMAYEPSPTDMSSMSVNDFRRSSSLSTSGSIQGDKKPNLGGELLRSSPGDNTLPIIEDVQGEQMHGHFRKSSDAELQMSMSGMDLDAMFAGAAGMSRRDESRHRW